MYAMQSRVQKRNDWDGASSNLFWDKEGFSGPTFRETLWRKDRYQVNTEKYRIESGPFVGQVDVADGVIVDAPLVWAKFHGQTPDRLYAWLLKCHGSYEKIRMGEDGEK